MKRKNEQELLAQDSCNIDVSYCKELDINIGVRHHRLIILKMILIMVIFCESLGMTIYNTEWTTTVYTLNDDIKRIINKTPSNS